MATGDIDTEMYLPDLRDLAARYEISADVEAVPSIQDWCRERGVAEENPFRAGKTLWNDGTGRHVILLACPITGHMISSVTAAMVLSRFVTEVAALFDAESFIAHLMLDEVAHALDESRSETDCDRWAFDELPANLPLHRTLSRCEE